MNFRIDDAFNIVYSRELLLKKLKLQFWQFYKIPIMNTEVTFYVYYDGRRKSIVALAEFGNGQPVIVAR